LNPYLSGSFDIQVNQSLLQGLNISVNNRNIRVARNNMKVTDLQVNCKWPHGIGGTESLLGPGQLQRGRAHQGESPRNRTEPVRRQQETSRDRRSAGHRSDPRRREVSSSKEDLLIAQTNVLQQEIVLKNALSRNGIENAWLDDVHIIPLDHIEIPKTDEIRRCRPDFRGDGESSGSGDQENQSR